MPLDKLILILVMVISAAAATVYVASLLLVSVQVPGGMLLLIPTALAVYVVYRVIADRIKNKEDNHYDSIEK